MSTACRVEDCPKGSVRLDTDGLCHLILTSDTPGEVADASTDSGSGTADTADPGPEEDCPPLPGSLSAGDPITVVASVETDVFMEYLDAVHLGDGRALLGANNGWSVLDLATQSFSHVEFAGARSVYRLAADLPAQRAYGGTQSRGLMVWDISTDPPTQIAEHRPWAGWHGDISAAGGRVLVAAGDEGAFLLEGSSGDVVAQIIESSVSAVSLTEDLAWVAGASGLHLYDLTGSGDPLKLASVVLPSRAVDAEPYGDGVVLALGGHGVLVVERSGDGLAVAAQLSTDGPAYGVAADGEQFWAATWGQISLGSRVDGVPTWLGDQAAASYALGVGASEGTAVVADWLYGSIATGDASVGGPELRMPRRLHVAADQAASFSVENGGLGTLDVVLADVDGVELSPQAFALCPGASARVTLDPGTGFGGDFTVLATTSDVDEPAPELELALSVGGVGTPHLAFSLPAITAGSTTTGVWSLADHAGELVYIAWFAPS